MKNRIVILIIFFLIIIKTDAQIPNNGFENWIKVGNCVEPLSWHGLYSLIDSTGNYCPVTKSTDHYPASEGSYSVRIANDTALWNSGNSPGNLLGWGILTSTKDNDKPRFHVSGHPKALCGYYKFLPENGDTMNINIFFYKNGSETEITRGKYQSNVAAPDWKSFKFFVSDTLYSSVDSARITISAANEPKNGSKGPLGNSVLYIDNLSFDTLITTGIFDQKEKNRISVFPSPASEKLIASFDGKINQQVYLKIFNILGQPVLAEKRSNATEIMILDISQIIEGIYFVQATIGDQIVYGNKIMIIK